METSKISETPAARGRFAARRIRVVTAMAVVAALCSAVALGTAFARAPHDRATAHRTARPHSGLHPRKHAQPRFTHVPKTVPYRARTAPVRLAEVLAYLRYLPATFRVSHGQGVPVRSHDAQFEAILHPPAGRYVFGSGWPAELRTLWLHDRSVVLAGAVRAFEAQHNLTMDGVAGAAVWTALLKAVADHQSNTVGYTYALASESSPETLHVYHNGKLVVSSLANTGVPGAATATGNFYVYERLQYQVMQGTNLDGSHYADPVYWVAYFNGGDAMHYLNRPGYGYPQSLGCIELPWQAAKSAWQYTTYGTVVTVLP